MNKSLNIQDAKERAQINILKLLAIQEDISELIKLNKELSLLSIVASHAKDVIVITDSEEKIEWVNKSFYNLTGYSQKEIIGKKPGALLQGAETSQEHIEGMRSGIRSKKPFNQVILNYNKDGKPYWLDCSISPIYNANGELSNFIAIQRDITEDKKKELELKEAYATIKEQNKQLKNFAYIVSHNLRSHAANVDSLTDLLSIEKEEQTKEKYRALLKDVSGKQLATLDTLNEAIAIRENKHIEYSEVNIYSVIADTLQIFKAEIEQHNINIQLAADTKTTLTTHKIYFESIALNLISNAIKYRDPSKNSFVAIKAESNAKNLVLQVKDNGLGIDTKRHSNRLFQMSQTFHDHPDAKGIGLFMVKNQVQALGGKIQVESEPGEGSTFTVTLPIHK